MNILNNLIEYFRKIKKEYKSVLDEKKKFREQQKQKKIEYKKERLYLYTLRKNDPGKYGEYIIFKILQNKLFNENVSIFQNVYVPYKGKTSEIDILLIHQTGIYVIESKYYSGWIFGSENQKYWTQTLNKYTKQKFYNPILQNETHIKAISEYIKIDRSLIKSIIVFSSECRLIKIPFNTEQCIITQIEFLENIIDYETKNKENILSIEDINKITLKLKTITNISEQIKQNHINNIKATFY